MVVSHDWVKYIIELVIYIACFIVTIIAFRQLDWSRFVKKPNSFEAWLLYIIAALVCTYAVGSLIIKILNLDSLL